MTILRERKVWVRERKRLRRFELTPREKANVKRRLRMLRARYGNWKRVAEALGLRHQHARWLSCRTGRPTAAVAVRIAKHERISVAAVLAGALGGHERCPMCGRLMG